MSQLQIEKHDLEQRLLHRDNPRGYGCDHCGSQNLKRTGNRVDPVFGRLGGKQALFTCNACGKESAFMEG